MECAARAAVQLDKRPKDLYRRTGAQGQELNTEAFSSILPLSFVILRICQATNKSLLITHSELRIPNYFVLLFEVVAYEEAEDS